MSVKAKNTKRWSRWCQRGAVLWDGLPPQVYLSGDGELLVIRIHWNSTSELQCSSSAKPVNRGMSDGFYKARSGHAVCQTDLFLSTYSGHRVRRPACLLPPISLRAIHHPSAPHTRRKTCWNVFRRTAGQILHLKHSLTHWIICGPWFSNHFFC